MHGAMFYKPVTPLEEYAPTDHAALPGMLPLR